MEIKQINSLNNAILELYNYFLLKLTELWECKKFWIVSVKLANLVW